MTQKTFSTPGRVEICGNHTDHQRGSVLAAAIDLEIKCTAEPNGTDFIRIPSEEFGDVEIDLNDLQMREAEIGTRAALVRGVAAWFKNRGYEISGFDATVTSDVPNGKGLSSSAAFEVLMGKALKGLFDLDVSPLDLAIAGQQAENNWFGKPCGLMDQVACSLGGCMKIDFNDPLKPVIMPVRADLSGYSLCLVATDDSHEDLTDDYAAIPEEMKKVAAYFGRDYLREVSPDEFFAALKELRHLGDRPVLRAIHFFEECRRVEELFTALQNGETNTFLRLITESGRSSLACLQNIYSPSRINLQGLSLALALAERVLGSEGACRIHGGGFAGSILAFVPDALKEEFTSQLSAVFGEGCCNFLTISKNES